MKRKAFAFVLSTGLVVTSFTGLESSLFQSSHVVEASVNEPVLKSGNRGAAVRTLQNELRRHGYKLTADGIFGAGTRNAVIQFQRGHKLGVDGIVGKQTWDRLLWNSSSTIVTPTVQKPTYFNGVLVASKKYPLPANYAPGENKNARAAFNQMQRDVRNAYGWKITAFSTYRSYAYQKGLFDRYVKQHGLSEASKWSAKAGHSEHQTGLAFDVGEVGREAIWTSSKMGDTEFGKWLEGNAHKYGFIIRYPKGKEGITGYIYEPWHLRYLGVDTATKVKQSGKTLEEYLGIN